MNTDNLNIRLDEDITNQLTVNKNLSQEIIVTNTDKVTIILNEHHKIIKKKIEWLSPLGIFVTIFATLLTAEFNKKVIGIDAILWKALFIVAGILSFAYCIYLIYFAIIYRNQGTITEFIEKLKNKSRDYTESSQAKTTKEGIKIISARYGLADKFKDITEEIKGLVSEEKLLLEANNKTWGDPFPGRKKEMKIVFTVNGVQKDISVPEGKTIDLNDYLKENQEGK